MKKLLLILILLVGCSKIEYKEITPKEAHDMIEKNDLIILDVRTKEEYNTSHLKDAINIPYDEIENTISGVSTDKNKIIMVYCQSGKRALTAVETLVELGYKNVYTFGGINSWEYGLEY